MRKTELCFMKKFFWKRIIGLCFCNYLCRMGAETYDAYEKRGISREIFRDTFYDLTFWCEKLFSGIWRVWN